ncbi:MAG: tetraacyldisaccharide 4'-kinase [Gammaproteobacteria bacterium]|nr:tetraacyldisaccharide 4'-kinase [Gammaproteobacteria bacterium]
MQQQLEAIWYGDHPLGTCLAPAGWLFAMVVALRRRLYRWGLLAKTRLPVPVVVIGNITVGGTGKTPLVVWAAELLRQRGHQPGIVCRGYLGQATSWPQQVRRDSDPAMVGDEAVMLARRTDCPVVAAGPARAEAAVALVKHSGCDLVLSDDGLQHFALARDLEIAVIDGERLYGNGRCLPAGPLREPVARLKSVDFVVVNGDSSMEGTPMRLEPGAPTSLSDPGRQATFSAFRDKPVHAACGIGNPLRFFRLLQSKGLEVIPHRFPDHHAFKPGDLDFDDDLPVLMTEKDAVKCARFAGDKMWYVPVNAVLPSTFTAEFLQAIGGLGKDG